MQSRRQFLYLAASAALAQDLPTFSTGVKVVNVLATVRTKRNEIVRDLTKDDFTLVENGRPQDIKYFSNDNELPLTLGLMVDTSMSQKRVLESERAASYRFLNQVVREQKDKLFVMQFDMAVFLRQPLTSSRKELEATLPYVDTPTERELALGAGAGGTLLYDAIVEASNKLMAAQANRKAMIVLSDGGENGSKATLSDAIEAAQKSDTLIYSILFSDATYYGGGFLNGFDGKGVLQKLARETGGSYFEVSKKRGISEIYGAIEDELRSQYNLGFVSNRPNEISEFRTLRLTTKQKGLILQYRDRYWAKA